MSSMLNSKYFTKLFADGDYTTYMTQDSPLVLFSEIDGIALASIHFKPSGRNNTNNDLTTKSLIAEYPNANNSNNVQRFQGLINNSDQEIEYVITNLSAKGCIIFNLLKSNGIDMESTSGIINEINVLNPNQSCVIQCDQTNNLPLILQKFKNEQDKAITVEKDEECKEYNKESNGVNILLSVIPQDNIKDFIARFEKTIWKTANVITVKCEVLDHRLSLSQPIPVSIPLHNDKLEKRSDNFLMSERTFSGNGQGVGYAKSSGFAGVLPYVRRTGNIEYFNTNTWTNTNNNISSYRREEPEEEGEEEVCEMGFNLFDDDYNVPRNIVSNQSVKSLISRPIIDDSIIKQSHIGKIGYGKKVIEVKTKIVDDIFDYEKTCRPCILSLSINNDLQFVNIDLDVEKNTLIEEAQLQLDIIKNKKFDDFIKGKIYDANECAICLSENPDCILYTCAHNCCHYECIKQLKTCPICRAYIIAKIQIKLPKISVQ